MFQCHPHRESSYLSSPVAMGMGKNHRTWIPPKDSLVPIGFPHLLPLAFDTEYSTKETLKTGDSCPNFLPYLKLHSFQLLPILIASFLKSPILTTCRLFPPSGPSPSFCPLPRSSSREQDFRKGLWSLFCSLVPLLK